MTEKRILVVDDDTDNLDALCALLRLWGYDADGADDGRRAIAKARASETDIVVMDLSLPGGEALEVIGRIKRENGAVVVVAYSGWQKLEAAARDAGADAFVLKPDLDSLQHVLARGGCGTGLTQKIG